MKNQKVKLTKNAKSSRPNGIRSSAKVVSTIGGAVEYGFEHELGESFTPFYNDPMLLFHRWFEQAKDSHGKWHLPYPEAMTLSTVSKKGIVTGRIVLLKEVIESGFVFFTNYHSRKGDELLHHKKASLLFYWPTLERQIRIEGAVTRVKSQLSDQYFQSRPRDSQLGAWASQQSEVLKSRAQLMGAFEKIKEKYLGSTVDRPPHWGGYVLSPQLIEFWQGQPHRLHERVVFKKRGAGWHCQLLNP